MLHNVNVFNSFVCFKKIYVILQRIRDKEKALKKKQALDGRFSGKKDCFFKEKWRSRENGRLHYKSNYIFF